MRRRYKPLLGAVALVIVPALVGACAPPPASTPRPPADAAAASPGPPAVVVRADDNVETVGALLSLAVGTGQITVDGRPFSAPLFYGMPEALQRHRDHPAVAATRELVHALGHPGFVVLALHAAPFGGGHTGPPRATLPSFWAARAGGGDEAAGRARLEAYLADVAAFYRVADVGALLDAHRAAYAGAVGEVEQAAPPPTLLAAMERYFGERPRSYTIIPTLTNAPFGNVAVSVEPDGADRPDLYFVLGQRVSVPEATLGEGPRYGFSDPADPEGDRRYLADLAAHEFGHSFVNPHTEAPRVAAEIDRHAYLMEPVRERMASQAYHEWYAVATEHMVRAGEVRVALAMGDTARAERLRHRYINERAFVYLPVLERAFARYEQAGPGGTGRYPAFGAFAPELARAFAHADTVAAYAALGYGPLREVTFRVTAPAAEAVYLTGSGVLGAWDPAALALARRGAAWQRTVMMREGTQAAFKVTRGSWDTEAAGPDGAPLPNASLRVRGDTTVAVHVVRWKDRE